MDDSQDNTHPRKKIKLDDQTMEANVEDSNAAGDRLPPANDSQNDRHPEQTLYGLRDQASREAQVGILEYVSPDSPGFTGLFKKRYADFIVNEILPSGEVVHLTTLNVHDVKRSKPHPAPDGDYTEKGNDPKPPDGEHEDITQDGVKSTNDATYATPESHQTPNEEHTEKEKDPMPANGEQQARVQAELDSDRKDSTTDPRPETAALAKWEESRNKAEVQVSEEDQADLRRFFDENTIAEMVHLFNKVINSPYRSHDQYGLVHSKPVPDRELRKEAHEVIKRIFRLRLDSSTDNKGVITVGAAAPKNADAGHLSGRQSDRGRGGRGRGRNKPSGRPDLNAKKRQKETFQDLGGDYLHFTLYKENKDTLEVISYIARQLNIRPNMFQFAGNKDRRAVTAQRASVYRIFPNRLSNLNRSLRNAKVGDFEFKKDKLVLGELEGNTFCITLRDCEFEGSETMDEETRKSALSERVKLGLETLCGKGFINYFGLQRFGSFETRTDEVGVKLLRGDLKGAIDAILQFSPAALTAAMDPNSNDTVSRNDKERAMAINMFKETGKNKPALDILPRKFSAESNIIHWLGEESRSTDYKSALESIPRNLRMMYVHAYQSLIWNLAATYRWKTWGVQVLAGDLVLVREHKDKVIPQDQNRNVDVDVEGEVVIRPGEEDRALTADDCFERARPLSAEEAASGQYTIYDIVLPKPGFDILYPEHMLSFYKDTMGSDQYGNLDPLDMTRSWKDVSLSGNYRKLLAKPLQGYNWSVHTYEGENEHLASTDLDILEARKAASRKQRQDNRGKEHEPTKESIPTDAPEDLGEAENGKQDVTMTDTAEAGDQSAETENAKQDTMEIDAPKAHDQLAQAGAEAETVDLPKDSAEQVPEPEAKPRKRIGVVLEFKLNAAQYATMAIRELMKHGGAREHKPDFSAGRGMD